MIDIINIYIINIYIYMDRLLTRQKSSKSVLSKYNPNNTQKVTDQQKQIKLELSKLSQQIDTTRKISNEDIDKWINQRNKARIKKPLY
jgi:hypothetical protein